MPRKNKPFDPAAIERKRLEARRKEFESVDLQPDAATLPQNEAVKVDPVTRPDPAAQVTGNELRAQRQDVFTRLYQRDGLTNAQLEAARRLERDMAERAGEAGGTGALGTRVDCARSIPVSDRSLAAAERVDAALARIGRRDADLLCELIEPRRVHTSEADRWRVVVRLITGNRDRDGQADAVRTAAEALAKAYRVIDHQPRSRAA